MASQEFRFYAHSLEGDPNADHWHGLEEHLRAVAKMAAEFAEAFQSRDWGYLSGLLHDLGKFQPEFQLKLMGSRISVEHSGIGAVKASELDKDRGIPLAFVVAGHHAGLANLLTGGAGLPSPLKERLRVNKPLMQRIQARVPGDLLDRPLPDFPGFLKARRKDQSAWSRSAEFWIRFLFSALVDADRLDTESFCQPTVSHQRGAYGSMPDLRKRLDAFIDNKVAQLPPEEKRSTLNRVRNEVLNACRVRARDRPGIFSLTAPTGGGKTLSAMSFALR